MTFWEQFALAQASVGLNMLLVRFGKKYLTPEEMAAAAVLIAAIASLPERIHPQVTKAQEPIERPDPQMFIKQ